MKLRSIGHLQKLPPRRIGTKYLADPKYIEVAGLLKNTIMTTVEIAKKTDVDRGIVSHILDAHNKAGPMPLRTRAVEQATRCPSGLNPDTLENPLKVLARAEQREILARHMPAVREMLSDFPDMVRFEVEQRARRRVLAGLEKYSQYLMGERHFVLLVAKRAVYEYVVEIGKKIGIKRGRYLGHGKQQMKSKILSPEERTILDEAVEKNTGKIRERLQGLVNPEEIGDVLHSAIERAYQIFDPKLHHDPENFLTGLALKTARRHNNKRLSEKWKLYMFAQEQEAQLPELQNRPKRPPPKSENL